MPNYRPSGLPTQPIPNGYATKTEYSNLASYALGPRPSSIAREAHHSTEYSSGGLPPERDAEELLKELENDPKNQRLLELVLERMDNEFDELRQLLEREALERGEPLQEGMGELSEKTVKELVENAVSDALRDHDAEPVLEEIRDSTKLRADDSEENSLLETAAREVNPIGSQVENGNLELRRLLLELDHIDLVEGAERGVEGKQGTDEAEKKPETKTEQSLDEVTEEKLPTEASSY